MSRVIPIDRRGPGLGSRKFVAANSEYLKASSAPVIDVPITMAAWVKSNDETTRRVVIGLTSSIDNSSYYLELRGNAGGDPLSATVTRPDGGGTNADSGNYAANTWHHVAGTFVSHTSRYAFLDGVKGSQSTVARVPDNINELIIGESNSVATYADGLIMGVGMWNVTLTDAEILDLARGTHPRDIRPMGLVFHTRLPAIYGQVRDDVGGLWLSDNNTVGISDNEPIVLRSRKWISYRTKLTEAAAVANPWYYYHQQRIAEAA